jgi:type IV secretory pathway TraG/TraD family ATPase VirD4
MSPSNELSPQQGIDPLAPLEQLVQWLAGATVHVVLGVLLGLLGARLMRGWHLHWSWAATAFVLILLTRAALAGFTATLGVAMLLATARSRRWHREDRQAGADLAELAAARWSPLDALRVGVCRVGAHLVDHWALRWTRLLAGRDGGTRRQGEELVVGADRHGRPVSIQLGGSGGAAHTLVVGATGSGKTVTQTAIATQAIARGMAAVVIDPKDDRRMREALRHAALAVGRRFIEWTPVGLSVYNPYARGGETEIADKALAGERFTEPHYQRQAQRYLGHAVRALRGAGREVSLASLTDALDPGCLELLARELPEARGRAVHSYLDSLTPRQRSDLTGVRDRLAIMAESDVGMWLDPGTPDVEQFDLLEAVRERAVVCFSLQADSRPLLSQMLGTAIVLDLQTVVSVLQTRPAPCLVVIDEFSAIAAEQVARLFARARSAGVSLLLGAQELSDLRLPGRETLLEQVLGNLTGLIAHRQVVPDSAELVARMAGTRGAWSTSWSSNGGSSRTRVREQLIDPDEVKRLERGCAAVIQLADGGHVAIARVLPHGQRL